MRSQPDGPGACAFADDTSTAMVRISVLPATGRVDAERKPGESAVVVTGIGVPAHWITPSPAQRDAATKPATTSSTALGTEDRIGGRLVLSPPDRRVVIAVTGQYNNSRMAEDIAKVVLDRL